MAEQDLRLAEIAGKLLTANAHLCRQSMPVTGMILHSADQYGDDVRPDDFAAGRVVVAQVVPGSVAEFAGARPGDAVLAINGTEIASLSLPEDGPLRDSVFDILAGTPPVMPVTLRMGRGETVREFDLLAPSGCLALFEITTERSLNARSDGRVIQLSYPLAALASDDQLAVIFAHELAHSVLEHRRRLTEAGVRKGFFGEFGRNRKYNRQVEIEADRMMVHLLANAGYDPAIAPAFFRSSEGRRVTGMLSFVYPRPKSRAELIEREIAMYLSSGERPGWPEHLLALRDQPFGED